MAAGAQSMNGAFTAFGGAGAGAGAEETAMVGMTTPGGRPVVRPSPTLGTSPVATRARVRVIAQVPPAARRDMTATELTHAVQHMISQAALDTEWFAKITNDIDEHATIINTTSMTLRTVHKDLGLVRDDARRAFDVIEKNDLSIKEIVDKHVATLKQSVDSKAATDPTLRADVQGEINRLNEVVMALRTPQPAQGASAIDAKIAAMEGSIAELNLNMSQFAETTKREFQDGTNALRKAHGGLATHEEGLQQLGQRIVHLEQGMSDLSQRAHATSACAAATAGAVAQEAQARQTAGPQPLAPENSWPAPSSAGPQVPMFPPQAGRPTTYRGGDHGGSMGSG